MSKAKEDRKASPKIRVWVKRETHDKVKAFAKANKKSIIEAYEHLINVASALSGGKP